MSYKSLAASVGVDEKSLKYFLQSRSASSSVPEILSYLSTLPIDIDHETSFIWHKLFPHMNIRLKENAQYIYPFAIKHFFDIDETHAISHFADYAGCYLAYRHAFDDEQVTTIWIRIIGPTEEIDFPTYEAFQRSAGGTEISGKGFVISSRTHVTLVGRKSAANIEMARLNRIEPPIKFLHGIVLTETRVNNTVAARVYCDRISGNPGLSRDEYDSIIKNLDLPEFCKELKNMGKNKDEIAKILFHIDNTIPNEQNKDRKVLVTSDAPSRREYTKYETFT